MDADFCLVVVLELAAEPVDALARRRRRRRLLLYTRGVCAIVANIWIPLIIFLAVPLILATADDDLEFVLNAFAATFIVNLDDLRDGAEITLTPADSYTELADEEEAEGPVSGADEAPSTTHV